MKDAVFAGFLESALADSEPICRDSDCLRISPDDSTGNPPRRYHGVLKGAEHYVRKSDGTFAVVSSPIPFQIDFADDYLRSLDVNLQFRVVRTKPDLAHPNVRNGVCCLGGRFRPATRLRSIVEQFYGIATSRVAAIGHPFDVEAAEFYLDHLDEIRGFVNEPLWRRALATHVRVERVETVSQAPSTTEAS